MRPPPRLRGAAQPSSSRTNPKPFSGSVTIGCIACCSAGACRTGYDGGCSASRLAAWCALPRRWGRAQPAPSVAVGMVGTASPLCWVLAYDPVIEGLARVTGLPIRRRPRSLVRGGPWFMMAAASGLRRMGASGCGPRISRWTTGRCWLGSPSSLWRTPAAGSCRESPRARWGACSEATAAPPAPLWSATPVDAP